MGFINEQNFIPLSEYIYGAVGTIVNQCYGDIVSKDAYSRMTWQSIPPRKQFLAILRLIAWKVGNVLCSKSLSWSSCVCGRPLFWLSCCGYVHSLGNFVSIVFWLTPKDWASTFSCNRANSCWFSESYVILIALHMYNKN